MSNRGERLKEAIRRRKHRKMLALAQDLAVDESAISRWKNGSAMSLEHASRVCEVLDISMDWLLLGRGDMEAHKAFQMDDAERRLLASIRALPPAASAALLTLLSAAAGLLEGVADS